MRDDLCDVVRAELGMAFARLVGGWARARVGSVLYAQAVPFFEGVSVRGIIDAFDDFPREILERLCPTTTEHS